MQTLRLFESVILILQVYYTSTSMPGSVLTNGSKDDARYGLGRDQLTAWRGEANRPRYGTCWSTALEALKTGCRDLTEEMQHRLTLAFTDCFLEKIGRKRIGCLVDRDVTECTMDMPAEAVSVYTQFFTHTQNICFYLEAEAWQRRSETTILRLADSSAIVSEQMENSSVLQVTLHAILAYRPSGIK